MRTIRSVIAQWKASIHKEGCGPRRFFTFINWRRILGTFIRVVAGALSSIRDSSPYLFTVPFRSPPKYFDKISALRVVVRKATGLRCALRQYNLLAVISGRTAAMNFNIYLDSTLGAALQRLAKRRKVARNALIRQAVEDLLAKESRTEVWSEAVLGWRGEPNFPPFESRRSTLSSPTDDPLA